jgi:hypothetical protein
MKFEFQTQGKEGVPFAISKFIQYYNMRSTTKAILV